MYIAGVKKSISRPGIFVVDFDSTFIDTEALDELAALSLKHSANKDAVVERIANITKQGMEGKIPFSKSLRMRLKLLHATQQDIAILTRIISRHITPSIRRNKAFFQKYADHIYILSGGFREYIEPVVRPFGIKPSHIFANTFIFSKRGTIIGYDTSNPLCKEGGKVQLLKTMSFREKIYMIGDGFSDFELYDQGIVDGFFAFTENVERKTVTSRASHISGDFDDVLFSLNLPRSRSYPKSRMHVCIIGSVLPSEYRYLKKEGYKITIIDKPDKAHLIYNRASLLIIGNDVTVTFANLKFPRLLAVGIYNMEQNTEHYFTAQGVAVFLPRQHKPVGPLIDAFIDTGQSTMTNNLPRLHIPEKKGVVRMLYLHKPTPGSTEDLRTAVAKTGNKIHNIWHKENETIGYSIIDILKPVDQSLLKKIRTLPDTLKVRILF